MNTLVSRPRSKRDYVDNVDIFDINQHGAPHISLVEAHRHTTSSQPKPLAISTGAFFKAQDILIAQVLTPV